MVPFDRLTFTLFDLDRAVVTSSSSSSGETAVAVAGTVPENGAGAEVTYYEPKLLEEFEAGNAALDKLKELGIEGALYEHQAAMTVQEQGKALGSVAGEKTKNLFLKVTTTPEYTDSFFVFFPIIFVQKGRRGGCGGGEGGGRGEVDERRGVGGCSSIYVRRMETSPERRPITCCSR